MMYSAVILIKASIPRQTFIMIKKFQMDKISFEEIWIRQLNSFSIFFKTDQ